MEKVSFIFVPYPMHSFMRANAEQKIFTLSWYKLTLNEAGDHSAMQVQTVAVLISRLFLGGGSCSTQPGKAFTSAASQLPSSFRRAVLAWRVYLLRCLFSTLLLQQESWRCAPELRKAACVLAICCGRLITRAVRGKFKHSCTAISK